MQYRAVIDQLSLPVALDAISATIFVAAFIAAALLTARRASWGLAALIVATPFAFYRDVLGTTVTLPKIVLLGVLLGLSTYPRLWRRDPAITIIALAVALYTAVTTLTIVVAGDRHAALRESLKWFEYLLIFAAAALCYREDPDDRLLAGAVAWSAIAVGLSALAQEVIGSTSALCVGAVDIPRIAGVLEGPNQLAGFLETAIAATAAWAVATRRTPLLDTALAIGTLAAILTFSRAGIGGVVIVLLSIGLIEGRAAFGALRWSLAGGAAGIAIAAGWAGYAHTPDILRANFAASTCAGGVGSRSQLYEAAWRLFVEHPWLGVGAGNFELDLPLAGVYGVRTHANSWYLQSLAEGGVALLLATLTVVAAILLSLGRRLRSSSPWVIAAFAATLALALHQIVDYLFFYPKVAGPWWIVVGIAAATLARPRVPAMA